MRGDQLGLEVAALDRRDRATELLDPHHLGTRLGAETVHLGLDHVRAGEQVVVLEEIELIGQHLLQPQRPLLVPGTGQP